jgi:hypothetical protein
MLRAANRGTFRSGLYPVLSRLGCVLMTNDGGKARIRAHREVAGLVRVNGEIVGHSATLLIGGELSMDHADPESTQLPCDC